MDQIILAHDTAGAILASGEGISFWGGVNAQTGVVQDAYHPLHGKSLAGKILLMPTSRGSCSGSGVLLDLAMNGLAPAALVFREAEDILTLGAFIAGHMYNKPVAVLRLGQARYDWLAAQPEAQIKGERLIAGGQTVVLTPIDISGVALTAADQTLLAGEAGPGPQLAMQAIQMMGAVQGAGSLIDVTRAHIDGCIYASPANLAFAEAMQKMGARVTIPTTMNAISVDFDNWQAQGVLPSFGKPARRLAQAYVEMGAWPNFTCAPYLEDDRPQAGEDIGWSESNAVIFANSALGARTVKHPDFFDLFVALTGRAPLSGVYLPANRQAQVRLVVDLPEAFDDAIWPLIGWLAGQRAPDRVPRLEGLENAELSEDDLKALCAAFGTTSAAPMLHVRGVTPEGDVAPMDGAPQVMISKAMMVEAWQQLNSGPEEVDLVALGSPHFSLSEMRQFARVLDRRAIHPNTQTLITLSRATSAQAEQEGLVQQLEDQGVRILRDLCWCSISEPVFPPTARHLVTNSGKYAHYGPGLSGRTVRFAALSDCATAAVTGRLARQLPDWLS